jgi:hypothetical protein
MEHPKPLREFLYNSFNDFATEHPWLEEENVRPKSIAREFIEELLTFSGYIKRYGLQRAEGLLLRHLNGVYKVLLHTVPKEAKTEQVLEMENYFGDTIRRTDSSLLDEWERLQNPNHVVKVQEEATPMGAPKGISADSSSFLASIRARIFSWLSSLQRLAYEDALDALIEDLPEGKRPLDHEGKIWTAARFQELHQSYREGHGSFRLDPEGRALRHTSVEKSEECWLIDQMLQDDQELNDWKLSFSVSLKDSDEAKTPLLVLSYFGEA